MKRLSSRFFRMCGRVGLGLVVGTLTACGGGGGGGGTGGGYEDALAPSELAAGSSSFTITFDAVPVEKDGYDVLVSLSFTCTPQERSTGPIESFTIGSQAINISNATWEHNGGSSGNILTGTLIFTCQGQDEVEVSVVQLEVSSRELDSEGRITSLSGMSSGTQVEGIVDSAGYIFDKTKKFESGFTIKYTYN